MNGEAAGVVFFLVLVGFRLLLLPIASQLSLCHFMLALVGVRIFLSLKSYCAASVTAKGFSR